MHLKIFQAGFSEEEVNKFFDENIIIQYQMNADGAGGLYVFFKPPVITGKSRIDTLEQISKSVELGESQILSAKIESIKLNAELEVIKMKIADLTPNQKEQWDSQQNKRIGIENQLKMHEDTISGTLANIEAIKVEGEKLLQDK